MIDATFSERALRLTKEITRHMVPTNVPAKNLFLSSMLVYQPLK
jgi:hypothetical protein